MTRSAWSPLQRPCPQFHSEVLDDLNTGTWALSQLEHTPAGALTQHRSLSLWLTTRKANAFPTSPPARSSSPGRVPSTYPYFAQNEVSSHETVLHSKHQGRYRASGLSLARWLMLQTPLATCFVFSTAVLPRSQHSKAPYLLGCLAELLSWKTTSEWGRGLAGFLPLLSQKDPAGPRRPA